MRVLTYFPLIGAKAGVAYYTENMINQPLENTNANIVLLTNQNGIDNFRFKKSSKLEVVKIDVNGSIQNILFQAFSINKYANKYNCDVVFYPSNPLVGFKRKDKRYISTIHDLNELEFKQKYSFAKSLYRRKIMLPLGISRSDKLITISQFSFSQIQKFYPNSINKVSIIENGTREFRKFENIKKEKLLLFVGRIDPIGKNLYKTLEVFDRLLEIDNGYKMIFAGGKFDGTDEFMQYATERFGEKVEFLGFVSDEELELLYNKSKYSILFSKLEGFGLTAFESLRCGTPIIINKECQVLNQLIGSIAITLDEDNLQDMTSIEELESKPELYQELSEKGIEFSKEYSWEKAAIKLNAEFQKLASDLKS